MAIQVVLMVVFVLPVLRALKRDFQRGLCGALAIMAFMTDDLALGVGSFQLTIHRALLVLVFLFWLVWIPQHRTGQKIPFLGLMIAWVVLNLVSLVFAQDVGRSLKNFSSFATEIFLFYVIISTSLTDLESTLGAFRALCISTAVIAVFGAIEYYTLYNPFLQYVGNPALKDEDDVLVSFKHRILFGYAMAIGWPLLLAQTQEVKGRLRVGLMTLAVMMTIGCCYFSSSRGPWFGSALAGGVMFVFASPRLRKQIKYFVLLSVLVLVIRPGVRSTLTDLVMSTFDKNSYRGESYEYRKLLWPVALDLVKVSPVRMLFGYGGQATETMDLKDKFPFGGSAKKLGYTSWDNNYAADLVEFGFAGLLLEAALYLCIVVKLTRLAWRCPASQRDRMAATLAGVLVFMFALSNVYMFSPQLKFIFLALVLLGTRLPVLAEQPALAAATNAEPGMTPIPEPEPMPAGLDFGGGWTNQRT